MKRINLSALAAIAISSLVAGAVVWGIEVLFLEGPASIAPGLTAVVLFVVGVIRRRAEMLSSGDRVQSSSPSSTAD